MKQEGISPILNQQRLFKSFRSVRLLSLLISLIAVGVCFLGLGEQNKAHAATYYVDNSITDTNPASATPDCTNYNTGTFTCSGGAGSAYKTIADVNAKSFSPDDQILFRKGQTWREQLTPASSGTSGHPITFGAFGSGANPIISGADIINGWSNYSGNVWQATVTTQTYIVIIDGSAGVAKTAIGNLTTNNDWYWASNVLYVYSTSDPSGKTIEAGKRTSSISNVAKDYTNFTNLKLTGSNSDAIVMDTSSYNNLSYLTVNNVGDGNDRGILISSDSYSYNDGHSTISNCTVDNIYGDEIFIQRVRDVVISYNTISNARTGPGGNTGDGIQLLDSSDITVSHNTVNQQGQDTVKGAVVTEGFASTPSGFIIEYNDISYGNFGLGVYQAEGAIIRYNTIHDVPGICLSWISDGAKDAQIYNNIIYNCNDGVNMGNAYDRTNVKIYNNTVYNFTRYGILAEQFDGEIKNNILWDYGATKTGETYYLTTKSGGAIATDYNLIGPDRSNFIRYDGTWYSTLAAYAAGKSKDTHSINSDPYFVGGGEAKPYPYFYPRSYSPVINAGTDVGLTKDYLNVNVPQGAAPDIGAFEYTVSVPENIWFFFLLFMAIPRLIFLLSSRQGRILLFILISKREYKSLLMELYLPYLNLASYLLKRII